MLISELAGSSIAELFEHLGEKGFRAHESQALAQALRADGVLVATGAGAVLSAANRQLMAGRAFVVHLHVSVTAQLERLSRDRTRPLLQRADREDVLRELARIREPLYREVADLVMDTDGLTAADAATRLCLQLASRWNSDGVAA